MLGSFGYLTFWGGSGDLGFICPLILKKRLRFESIYESIKWVLKNTFHSPKFYIILFTLKCAKV